MTKQGGSKSQNDSMQSNRIVNLFWIKGVGQNTGMSKTYAAKLNHFTGGSKSRNGGSNKNGTVGHNDPEFTLVAAHLYL